MSTFLPGATIGMLGGGQLGRMFTTAARSMGYEVVVFDPDAHSPAAGVATAHICASYSDEAALRQFADLVDVVTTEFENIPADTLRFLAGFCPVRPGAAAVEIAQNRIREKTFIRDLGLATAPFIAVNEPADLAADRIPVQFPAILKSAELGYDGKGQVVVHSVEEARDAFASLKQVSCVLEQRVSLEREVSVVMSRDVGGGSVCFPVAENEHRGGILFCSAVPARVDEALQQQARDAAMRLAAAMDFVGVMAVEFFITTDGELLVNEIAPRTHNSGHYTIDACITSQFEQHVRAVCGMPVGSTRLHSPVAMINLLGDIWLDNEPDWVALMQDENVRLHLYGKKEARAGRKMGHFCVIGDQVDACVDLAHQYFDKLAGQA